MITVERARIRSRSGDNAHCTTPIAGRPLSIDITYTPSGRYESSECTASYAGAEVWCQTQINYYRSGSHSVWITDQLPLTQADMDGLQAALPIWFDEDSLLCGALGVAVALGLLAGSIAPRDRSGWRVQPIWLGATTFLSLVVLFALLGTFGYVD